MRPLKVFFSALFVLAVGYGVARWGLSLKPRPLPPYEAARPLPSQAQPAGAPKMAIVLDDWGNNFALTRQAVSVGRPLTLAVLPHLAHSRRIAEEAHRRGLGVMLHMPMQPDGRRRLEPRTILTTSSDDQIRRMLDEALASVPHAEGVNNHMGSAATQDARVMRTVLSYLKRKGLFFVDSRVISDSMGEKMAKRLGLPSEGRDVFIDNEPEPAAVKERLREAARLAVSRGEAVVIGHDKKVTLQAIREMVPEIERAGVRLVLVKEILDR